MRRNILAITVAVVLVAPLTHAATLGVPGEGTTLSGVSLISGWKCEVVGALTIQFFDANGTLVSIHGEDTFPLAHGSFRPDTEGVCGDVQNGFSSTWNWGEMADGQYTAVVSEDSVEFDRNTFTVVTFGENFVRGASGRCTIPNFPSPGESAQFVWNQSTQHLELSQVDRDNQEPEPASCEGWGTSRWESDVFVGATTQWVRHCLDAGADPNARGQYGETPLHRIAWASYDNAEAVRLLISRGADVNARSHGGTTPLHLAASWPDNFAIVVALLDAGADPNAMNNNGHTPLYYHDNYGLNPEIERALVNAGADPNIHPLGEPIECSTPECAAKLG